MSQDESEEGKKGDVSFPLPSFSPMQCKMLLLPSQPDA
jgi:hypothetical protein